MQKKSKVHHSKSIRSTVNISLTGTNVGGKLIFKLSGDLPQKSFRGEGRHVVELLNNECIFEVNNSFFQNGVDFSQGRAFLAALFIFHPTWNALGSVKEMIHMGFEPSKEITSVHTNLSCPNSMLELLKNEWMLPNLEFHFDSTKNCDNSFNEPLKPSLAFGGGLDSGAAICILEDEIHPYYIANLDPHVVRSGITKILNRYSGSVIKTNVRSLYSVSGFPHWMIPYIPSMLRGDKYCLTGSILESQYLRDGLGYHNSTGNLWLKMLKLSGVEPLPLSCHSEFTNAIIASKSGFIRDIAGNCIDEWGMGYKALRKAVLLRPFDEYYEEIIQKIEENGFILDPKFKFSQSSKMLTSTSKAAILVGSNTQSKSIKNLIKFVPHSILPWGMKFHPDNFKLYNWPENLLEKIKKVQNKMDIQPMDEHEISILQSYNHERFFHQEYDDTFIQSVV
jgi:hypothetical protein